jgi:hypothetical protein
LKISEDYIFCLKDHILFAFFEAGGVVFDLDNRVPFAVNRTGAGVLKLLNGRRDVKEVIRSFAREYKKPEENLGKDINNFLINLIEKDWLYVKKRRRFDDQ